MPFLTATTLTLLLSFHITVALDAPGVGAGADEAPVRLSLANQSGPNEQKQSTGVAGGGRSAPAARDSQPIRTPPPGLSGANTAQAGPGGPERAIRVYTTRHTSLSTIADIVNERWGNVMKVDAENGHLIYFGPPDYIAPIEKLIATVDAPNPAMADERDLVLVRVVNRDPRDIVAQLVQTSLRRSLSLSADSARSFILLDGDKDEIGKAKALIQSLDIPQVSCEAEFAFFAARSAPASEKHEMLATPEDLAALADELKRFGEVEFLARMSSVVTQDETFQLTGGIGSKVDVQIQGKAEAGTQNGPVTLAITCDLRLLDATGKPGPRFGLKTTLTTQRDEFVVLGSAPSGWEPGESIIMAVRIPSSTKN